MSENKYKNKEDNLHINNKLKIFYRNIDIGNYYKYNLPKTTLSGNHFFDKNKYINTFKYDKLYFHEKEKNFSKELRKQKIKKVKINLKKINKFHQLLMHDKIQSFTESKDYNDLTIHNKTTNQSEFIPINLSSNKNIYKTISFKNSNLQRYNKEIESMKINNNISLIKNNITLNKTTNKFLSDDFENSKSISLRKNKIKEKNIISSDRIKKSIKMMNYRFKDIFGNPNDNIYTEGRICSYRYPNNCLSEQTKNKLKYNLINKIQKEFFQKQKENGSNPIKVYKYYELFHRRNKDYFLIFQNLLKKYFGYLYSNIENEKHELLLLMEQKQKIKEEIVQLYKKINSQKEKLNLNNNFLELLIKIKYNVDSLDKIPNEYLIKYGIIGSLSNIKKEKKIMKRRNSMLITELKDNIYKKYLSKKSIPENINRNNKKLTKIISRKGTVLLNNEEFKLKFSSTYKSKSPQKKRNRESYKIIPKIPIFNGANELEGKMKRIEYNLMQQFEQSFNEIYTNQKLKLELDKIKLEFMGENKRKLSNSFFQLENEELQIQKQKNNFYINFKNYLEENEKKYIEYEPKTFRKNAFGKNSKNKYNFSEKLISILLKLNINIEKISKQKGIYKFLNSSQEYKIIYNSKEYNKTLFCLKILEEVLFYLIEERTKILSDDKKRDKYLELEEEINKKKRNEKLRAKAENDYKRKFLRDKAIILKSNEFRMIPIKKDDPYSFYFKKKKVSDSLNKKSTKKEENNKFTLIIDNEILF